MTTFCKICGAWMTADIGTCGDCHIAGHAEDIDDGANDFAPIAQEEAWTDEEYAAYMSVNRIPW